MTAFDPDRLIDALAPALGLEIRPEWRDGVTLFLRTAAAMAALLDDTPPGADLTEAAAVFRPGEPR
jgi:hypothetical protein